MFIFNHGSFKTKALCRDLIDKDVFVIDCSSIVLRYNDFELFQLIKQDFNIDVDSISIMIYADKDKKFNIQGSFYEKQEENREIDLKFDDTDSNIIIHFLIGQLARRNIGKYI